MIQEVVRGASESDTLPRFALQPLSRQAPPRQREPKAPVFDEEPRPRHAPALSQPPAHRRTEERFLQGLVVLFAVLNVTDLVSTFIGLHSGLREGNPLMSALLGRYGFIALVVYKALVVAAVTVGVRMLRSFRISIANVTIIICNLLVLLVVLANIAQYFVRP